MRALPFLLSLLPLWAAQAATLRPFRELTGARVMLSDLFERLECADRVLGASPAPGDRIVVEAPQLAAIARDFGVAWRPVTGAERIVLERAARRLARDAVLGAVRAALREAAAPADAELVLDLPEMPLLPAGADARPEVTQLDYDAVSGRFAASVSLTMADAPAARLRVSGAALPMADAVVLVRRLRPGSVVAPDDVRPTRVRAAALRGAAALTAAHAVGMALRHDLPPGLPLTAGDVARPLMVARNAAVHVDLSAQGIALSAQAVALEDGGIGDRIRVQNPASRAVFVAEITGANALRVVAAGAPLVVAQQ